MAGLERLIIDRKYQLKFNRDLWKGNDMQPITTTPDVFTTHAQGFTGASLMFAFFFGFIGLIVTILMVWVYCRIFSKAGFSWALGLLMFVPIANIIMPFVLAFSDWPVHKELRTLKQQQPQIH